MAPRYSAKNESPSAILGERDLETCDQGKIMNFIAIKMLLGDRAKYIGIIIGLTFASFLVTWPSAIFTGVMSRTFSFVTDVGLPDIWVSIRKCNTSKTSSHSGTQKCFVSAEQKAWNGRLVLYKGMLRARMNDGTFQSCVVVGLDDATLIGGPPKMLAGQLADLRQADSVIVDEAGARGKLARRLPDGRRIPLKLGDTLELNDHRCVVVGICRIRNFSERPSDLYDLLPRDDDCAAGTQAPFVYHREGETGDRPARGLRPYPRDIRLSAYHRQFKKLTFWYFLKYTGMPFNFLTVVSLGFIVGVAISGMTFYNFTLDNLRYFGTLKAWAQPIANCCV